MAMKTPVHPGQLVKANVEALGLSVPAAAAALGVTRQQLYNVMAGRSAISPEMAVRLEKAMGGSADHWLRMQNAHDLSLIRSEKHLPIRRIKRKAA
ncbi:MAG TPA: HigA family addiction module antitoxin [Caulobacterales bacterium]|jgi:addiction module HigA family antidote|nr:HigA family addiction module antitoxin [Caulobacterales bacterium]